MEIGDHYTAAVFRLRRIFADFTPGAIRMRQAAKRMSIWLFAVARCAGIVMLCGSSGSAVAEDWPSYRNGPARVGSTSAELLPEATARWVYRAPAPPRMAWSSAEGRVIENHLIGHLVKYDDAIHPVVAGQHAYIGSSVDHHLHCFNIATGQEVWSFASGGPIRLAPSVDQGRVYFGSDDGYAYCLSAQDGSLIWKHLAGPTDSEWLLARGEMISRWPVRTGVLVDQGVAFFGAGIFPHEDVFLYAVNAADGTLIWQQDNISVQDAGRNDLSPQGYLLAGDDLLFVPSGRSLPAAFDRRTGEFVHKRTHSWRTTAGGVVGGVQSLVADEQLYASGPHHWLAMEQKTGDVGFGWFDGRQIVVQGDQAYALTGQSLVRMDRLKYAVNSRRRHELEMIVYDTTRKLSGAGDQAASLREKIADAEKELKAIEDIGIDWKVPSTDDACLITTRNLVFVGGPGRVTAFAVDTGEQKWQAAVEGEARGLVAGGGHLLVSTNAGHIYAFAAADSPSVAIPETPQLVQNPYPADEWTTFYEQAAEDILQQAGDRRGFCLIAGSEDGRLAFELAKRSELQIYGIENDPEKAARARRLLISSGHYGHRIVIHQTDASKIPYSNYFANLVVSDTYLRTGRLPADPELLTRHIKPLGGKLVLGQPAVSPVPADPQAVWTLFEKTGLQDQSSLKTEGTWNTLTRHGLPGAGDWSHQYGTPSNTAVSRDTRVRTDLGVLWYGDPGPGEMVNRHEGAVGPLATNGRLYVQGEWSIMAYDAYNGLFLWKHENPEALRTGVFQNQNPANLAASDDRLFHFVKDQCLELDAATGRTLRVHRLPAEKDDGQHHWGYVATQNGLLFGAATVRNELEARQRRRGRKTNDSTDVLFAIDLETGKHLWQYTGKSISHHTIAVGQDSIFFIDSSISSEQREALLREDKSHLEQLTGKELELAEERAKAADVRRAVALESRSGKKLWETSVDVTDCSDIGAGGGKLSLMVQNGVLILGGANANGHYWKQFVAGEFSRRRLVALSAADGYKLWAKDANYKGRPIIMGEKVLAEPWAFDLQSGVQQMRQHPLTGEQVPWSLMRTGHHCGILTGSDSGMLLFRSGDTAFYDLETDGGTRHFAGHRLGCWINAIAANGLIMIPEASAGCVCQFSIASTIVLEPREKMRREWMIQSAAGARTPVKSMSINLGAPGDRKDADGKLWLSYPRRKAYQETTLDVALDFQPVFADGGGFDGVSEKSLTMAGPGIPWVYSSWAQGLQQMTIPLLGAGDQPSNYDVRLHFARNRADGDNPIIFDVELQGRVVLENVTLPEVGGDGAATALIHDVPGVAVSDNLTVRLLPKQGTTRLHAIEVSRVPVAE